MAAEVSVPEALKPSYDQNKKTLASYLGLGFAVFLGFLPKASISLVSSLHARNKTLSLQLFQAEEQLALMRSRRKEDSKANARVVEIFASHRNGWQQEEKRLMQQIDASAEEIARLKTKIEEIERSEAELRTCVEKLQREVEEREEMINFMSRKREDDDFSVRVSESETGEEFRGFEYQNRGGDNGVFSEYTADFSRFGSMRGSQGFESFDTVPGGGDEPTVLYGQQNGYGFDFLPSASKVWTERSSCWQDPQYESLESLYHMKHFVGRRESPWKVDGESTGVSTKLKLLEQELLNLERIGSREISKVPSLLRKQAKRYQALTGKINDLCRKMQDSDPCEPTLSSEFRTQRQTEFLLEAFRLQQRAIETGQKLTALQAETQVETAAKSHFGEELGGQAKQNTRRSFISIRNNFKEIQRNLEIWLARIMGDLEGILARDGASRVREYYVSRYPFIQ